MIKQHKINDLVGIQHKYGFTPGSSLDECSEETIMAYGAYRMLLELNAEDKQHKLSEARAMLSELNLNLFQQEFK